MGAAAASGHVQIMRYLAFTQVCMYIHVGLWMGGGGVRDRGEKDSRSAMLARTFSLYSFACPAARARPPSLVTCIYGAPVSPRLRTVFCFIANGCVRLLYRGYLRKRVSVMYRVEAFHLIP